MTVFFQIASPPQAKARNDKIWDLEFVIWNLKNEAAVGFEPTNKGFADPRLRPLGHAAVKK